MQSTSTRTASVKTFRLLALIAFVLLVIEFLFGMVVNLFVSIPTPLPGITSGGLLQGLAWSLAQTSVPILLLHVVLGLMLVLVSLALLVLSIIARQGRWVAVSLIAAGGIIIAALSGSNFVVSGVAVSSLMMALGSLLALLSYAIGLYIRG